MGADDRVTLSLPGIIAGHDFHAGAPAAGSVPGVAIGSSRTVNCAAAMNCTPQFDRQGGQRAYAVGEMGATADGRDDLGVKDRGAWWGGLK